MELTPSSCPCPATSSSSHDLDVYTPLIRHEFEALKASGTCQCEDLLKFSSSVHPNNTHKNRYYNILANEDSRVRLAPLENTDEDYINANYIDGEVPDSKRAYILTQAPLAHTTADFWRMVWQEKSPVIACLTMLRENHKTKAHKYWPEDGQMQQYGKIFVVHNLSVLFKSIIVRSFSIWKDGENIQPMEVLQLHYQDWPDFGTPSSTESIRALSGLLSALKDRRKQRNGDTGPAIIHCSAGVGRAGTLAAIHITLTKLEYMAQNRTPSTPLNIASLFESPLSIKETVAKLRRQRAGSVQTLEQYNFIYKAIADTLQQLTVKRHSGKRAELETSGSRHSGEVVLNSNKDKVGVSAFLDILSGRPSKCTDSSTQGISSSSEQLA